MHALSDSWRDGVVGIFRDKRQSFAVLVLLGTLWGVLGCAGLTREEAAEALEEARMYSEASSLIGNTVELSGNFSIGQATADAAQNLLEFYESQLPCAAVSQDASTVLVEYGAEGNHCEHRGMTFSGSHEVTVSRNENDDVIVDHVWTDLENGSIMVSGTAEVTWSGGDDPSRRVVHDLSWTRLEDGREAAGRGDRVQRPLDGDITEGFTVTGDASWRGESGDWDLAIRDVEMRWRDPVPQKGRYMLDTPFDASMTLEFTRDTDTSVDVTIRSGRREYEFSVPTPP